MTGEFCRLKIIPFNAPSLREKRDLVVRVLKNMLVKGGARAKKEDSNEEGSIFEINHEKIKSALETYSNNLTSCPFYDAFKAEKPAAEVKKDKYFLQESDISFSFERVTFVCPYYKNNECTSPKKNKNPDDSASSLDNFFV